MNHSSGAMRVARTAIVVGALACTASLLPAHVRPFTQAAVAQSPASEQLVHKGDPVQGKETFEKRCTGCHALTSDREGPRLQTVFGRTSGTVEGFAYSAALKNAHIVWDQASLEKWLTDPDVLVPGNNMGFHVPKAQERLDLIEFLKTAPLRGPIAPP